MAEGSEIARDGLRLTKALGRKVSNASPGAKSAGTGAALLGGLGLSFGPHIGIAALGTAISGAVVLPVAGAAVGAVAGYAAYVAIRDRKRSRQS